MTHPAMEPGREASTDAARMALPRLLGFYGVPLERTRRGQPE